MKDIFDKRYLILALLFMARTIPSMFFLMALPVILRLEGYALEVIALMQLASVPFLLKFLWAPFLDRRGERKKHYKNFILWTGIISSFLLIAMGYLDLKKDFNLLIILVVLTSFFASTLDIAISALYIKLLKFEERGKGSSTKIFGFNLGSILGSGFFLLLYNHFGWQVSVSGIALMVLLSLTLLPFLYEGNQKALKKEKSINLFSIFSFFKKDGMFRWMTLIILNTMPASAVFFIIKPFLVDKGVETDKIAFLMGFYGLTIGAFTSMIAGNQWFQNFLLNRRRAYLISIALCALSLVFFIPIAVSENPILLLYPGIAFLNASITISTIVTDTLVMDFSRKGFASVDYALQMTGIHLGGMLLASISGFIVAKTGYLMFFTVQAGFAGIMIFISLILFNKKLTQKSSHPISQNKSSGPVKLMDIELQN